MRQVTIKPLETGFIVEHDAAAVAALSNADDLVDWIIGEYDAARFGPPVGRLDHPAEAIDAAAEETAPPQPSEPSADARGVTWDDDKISELQGFLAGGKTYDEAAEHFGVTRSAISGVVARNRDIFASRKRKQVAVKCKPDASDLPEKIVEGEEKAGVADTPTALSSQQKRVLRFIRTVVELKGRSHFSLLQMSIRTNIKKKDLPLVLKSLRDKGEIVLEMQGDVDPWIDLP